MLKEEVLDATGQVIYEKVLGVKPMAARQEISNRCATGPSGLSAAHKVAEAVAKIRAIIGPRDIPEASRSPSLHWRSFTGRGAVRR